MVYNNTNVNAPAPTTDISVMQHNSSLNTNQQCYYEPAKMSSNINGSFVDASTPSQFNGNQIFNSAGSYKQMGSYDNLNDVIYQVITNRVVI